MIVLDCQNEAAAYDSLEEVLALPKYDLRQWLSRFDLEQYCEDFPYEDSDKALLKEIQTQLGCVPAEPDGIYYFHLTRTHDPHQFCQGIEPLSEPTLDQIWSFLYTLQIVLSLEKWTDLRGSIEENSPPLPISLQGYDFVDLYNFKRNRKILTGPFGMLVRDTAFTANNLGNHDYLAIPEIVQDICHCFQKGFDFDLESRFKESTEPCLVKFKAEECNRSAVSTALNYLYEKIHKQYLSNLSVCDFDSKGDPISANQIACIECPSNNVIWGSPK